MRSRDVVGRRIVAVNQERVWNETLQRSDVALYSLVLDNGSHVVVMVAEDDPESYVRAWVQR